MKNIRNLFICLFLLIGCGNSISQNNYIENNFKDPDFEYGPWVFWMWMNGNVSKQGITLDLEAMHRIGISGAVLFSSDAGIPRGNIEYASREWLDMNKHMFAEAKKLGMKIMLHNGPGYTITGAPWITPENSMQQLVYSETFVRGENQNKLLKLPRPYAKRGYYEDALVIAYPSLLGEDKPMQTMLLNARVNGENIDKGLLFNNNYDTSIEIEVPKGSKRGELTLSFKEPFKASSIVIRREHTAPPRHPYDGDRDDPPMLTIEYSDDGVNYKELSEIGMPQLRELNAPTSRNFETVKAKYYRILSNKSTKITELLLYTAPRLQDWEYKANYNARGNRNTDLTIRKMPEGVGVDPGEVIDLTSFMKRDGILEWKIPEGNWTILRFGHTTTGEENAAGPFNATGLEVDKLSKRGIRAHYDKFLKKLFDEMEEFRGNSFYGISVDSWEAGAQNWTKGFEKIYAKRTQQSIIPFIAAFTGRIVEDTSTTELFLENIRRLQATLLAENFHGELRNICHEHDLCFLNETYGDGVFNSIEAGKHVDIPTGEFWAHGIYGGSHTNNQAGYLIRKNGQKIAASEAFTARPELSKFTEYPAEMKNMGDWMFANGINRFMYHTFAHQPHSTAKPGMTMGPFGTHFNRNQTWWEQSKAYIDYIRRCQFVLQHGSFISNSSPWIPPGMTVDPTQQRPDFDFTVTNTNAIIHYIHRRLGDVDYYFVANGKRNKERIIASFNVSDKQPELWNPETGEQTLISNFEHKNGKTLIPIDLKPSESMFIVFKGDIIKKDNSFDDLGLSQSEPEPNSYKDFANSFSVSVWLRPDVDAIPGRSYVLYPVSGEKLYGEGCATIGLVVGQNGIRLFEQAGERAEEVLFAKTKIEGRSLVNIVYEDGKPLIYLNGRKVLEGKKSPYDVFPNDNELAPVDPMLILFQGEYTTPEIQKYVLTSKDISSLYKKGFPISPLPDNTRNTFEIKSPWRISFPDNAGAPKQIVTRKLSSLHLNKNTGVKYFSGTVTYETTFNLPVDFISNDCEVKLDLGNVAFFAEIIINDRTLPTLWKPPYSSDITEYVKQHNNVIKVKVTNLWTNRLIGDEYLPQENKYDGWGELDEFPTWYVNNEPYKGKRNAFVSWKQYDKNGPLTESGLIGPVRIYTVEK